MEARFGSWWQKVRKPLKTALIAALLLGLVTVIVLVIAGYLLNWDWTGLGPYSPPGKNRNFQRGKTLWDWLQLLVIPFVLAVGGYLFNYTASRNEQKATQVRDQTERDIALDNQRETALQDYIDKLSELLMKEKLRELAPEDEVRKMARVRTLIVLPRLDKERKRSVLQFLYESGLIDKGMRIIDLDGADLGGANLSGADLSGADLGVADLSGADLSGADLGGAYLIEADLGGANLSEANLSRANLSRADLDGANLSGTNLSGANLSRAILDGANLNGADLSGADLSGAYLSGADLSEANLGGADLGGAYLSRADLGGANLSGADLGGADLSRADLSGANLREAKVALEQLNKAKLLTGAIMPDGLKHP